MSDKWYETGPWFFDKRNSPYDNAKIGAISGIGYFALTNPQGLMRAIFRIGGAMAVEQVGTLTKAGNILREELLIPEAVKQRAKGFPASGSLWSVSPWIPMALFGTTLINGIESIRCTIGADSFAPCPGQEGIPYGDR
jgi:hypothetical protein